MFIITKVQSKHFISVKKEKNLYMKGQTFSLVEFLLSSLSHPKSLPIFQVYKVQVNTYRLKVIVQRKILFSLVIQREKNA
jgi:hypothetical protein